jgi:hypothetical protein
MMKIFETQIAQGELQSDGETLEAPISLTPEQLDSVDLELVSGGSVSTILGGIFWWLRN